MNQTGRHLKKKTIILGLGSEVLGDKSLPLRLVGDLDKEGPRGGMYFAMANTGGLDLLEQLEGFDVAVIIDTVMAGKAACGLISMFGSGDPFPGSLHLPACPNAGSPVPVMMGKKLGLRLPREVRIISVGIPGWLEFSMSFSDPIQAAYKGILGRVRTLVVNATKRTVKRTYTSNHSDEPIQRKGDVALT